MSAAVPARPTICSGAMNPAEPIVMPALVTAVASSTWAIPKSMTFGPPAVSSTFEGLRSRCTIPAAWIAVSASASPVARPVQHLRVHRPAGADVLGERGSLGVLGDQERPGRGGVRVDHPHRAHAPDPGERGHLAAEPGPELGVVGHFGPQHLQRHRAAVLARGKVHDAHPARAEPGQQLVRTNPRRVSIPQGRARQPSPPSAKRQSSRIEAGRRDLLDGVICRRGWRSRPGRARRGSRRPRRPAGRAG